LTLNWIPKINHPEIQITGSDFRKCLSSETDYKRTSFTYVSKLFAMSHLMPLKEIVHIKLAIYGKLMGFIGIYTCMKLCCSHIGTAVWKMNG